MDTYSYSKHETDFELQKLKKLFSTGYINELNPEDTAPSGGWKIGLYRLLKEEVYPNLTPSLDINGNEGPIIGRPNKINEAKWNGTTWSKSEVEMPTVQVDQTFNPTSTDPASQKAMAEWVEDVLFPDFNGVSIIDNSQDLVNPSWTEAPSNENTVFAPMFPLKDYSRTVNEVTVRARGKIYFYSVDVSNGNAVELGMHEFPPTLSVYSATVNYQLPANRLLGFGYKSDGGLIMYLPNTNGVTTYQQSTHQVENISISLNYKTIRIGVWKSGLIDANYTNLTTDIASVSSGKLEINGNQRFIGKGENQVIDVTLGEGCFLEMKLTEGTININGVSVGGNILLQNIKGIYILESNGKKLYVKGDGVMPIRYIRDYVRAAETTWLEITAYDKQGANIAHNKAVTLQHIPYPNRPALSVLVNNNGTDYDNWIGTKEDGYVEIDLLNIYPIKEVRAYYTPQDALWSKTEVSADGINWVKVYEGTFSKSNGVSVKSIQNISGQYIPVAPPVVNGISDEDEYHIDDFYNSIDSFDYGKTINRIIATMPDEGGAIIMGRKKYNIETQVIIDKNVSFLGKGGADYNSLNKFCSAFYTNSNTLEMFKVIKPVLVRFKDLHFYNSSTVKPTAGCAIRIIGIPTPFVSFQSGDELFNSVTQSEIYNCTFKGFYDNVVADGANQWHIVDNVFADAVRYNLIIDCMQWPDAGDSCLRGNNFKNWNVTTPCEAHVYFKGSGGLKISDNKFNTVAKKAIKAEVTHDTVILLISANSFENYTENAIYITKTSNVFRHVNIIGNEFDSYRPNVKDISIHNGIQDVNIVGNSFSSGMTNNSNIAINLNGVQGSRLMNTYRGYTNPINIYNSTDVKQAVLETPTATANNVV